MSIHTDHYLDRPDFKRKIAVGDILWAIGTGLAAVCVSPMLAVYLLLVN